MPRVQIVYRTSSTDNIDYSVILYDTVRTKETMVSISATVYSNDPATRTLYLLVNGERVSAPSFRIQIGANKLRSTLIDDIEVKDGKVTFQGRGFGHGVGLSQWGAYRMAEEGADAEAILQKYFPGVEIVELW